MRQRGWWLAMTLVLLTNLLVLMGAAWNRSGEPEAVIRLTERELPIAHQPDEDTGLSLTMSYGEAWDLAWLDRSKLETLGFDGNVEPPAKEPGARQREQLPRRGFLVLEHGGEAWRSWLAGKQQELEETRRKAESGQISQPMLQDREELFRKEPLARSRLLPVDAGPDPEELRGRYPQRDRFLILPAVFSIRFDWRWNLEIEGYDPPVLRGAVSHLLVRRVHVPRGPAERLRSWLRDQEPWPASVYSVKSSSPEPRYTVTLRVGRRYEPWIEDVAPIE